MPKAKLNSEDMRMRHTKEGDSHATKEVNRGLPDFQTTQLVGMVALLLQWKLYRGEKGGMQGEPSSILPCLLVRANGRERRTGPSTALNPSGDGTQLFKAPIAQVRGGHSNIFASTRTAA
jgi:hypothetical protein